MIHDLKTWPQFFQPVALGHKTFEIRFNDRDFKVGDVLRLREWDPAVKKYTGNETIRRVTYITDFPAGLRDGFVVMGVTPDHE